MFVEYDELPIGSILFIKDSDLIFVYLGDAIFFSKNEEFIRDEMFRYKLLIDMMYEDANKTFRLV